MNKRPLSEGERVLLSAALMNQARLERAQGIPVSLHDRLNMDHGSEPLAGLDQYVNRCQDRGEFFELFAKLVIRGNLVVDSPVIIPAQA